MKKVISLFLAALIIFSFSGCGNKDKQESGEHPVNISEYAQNGQIPEVRFKLGTSETEISEYYAQLTSGAQEGDNYSPLAKSEGKLSVRLDAGSIIYYYQKSNKDKGISVIVSFDTAYDFQIGSTLLEDVRSVLGDKGTVSQPSNDDMFFFPGGAENATCLSYLFNDNRLDFFFVNGFLSATVLTNTQNWTI